MAGPRFQIAIEQNGSVVDSVRLGEKFYIAGQGFRPGVAWIVLVPGAHAPWYMEVDKKGQFRHEARARLPVKYIRQLVLDRGYHIVSALVFQPRNKRNTSTVLAAEGRVKITAEDAP